MRRTRGRVVVTALFALLTLNAWAQVILILLGRAESPTALTALQVIIGALAAGAAWGSWTGRRWAPTAATLYGVVTAGMLVALESLLGLGADERGGLWAGAAVVLLVSLLAAWYLHRIPVPSARDVASTAD